MNTELPLVHAMAVTSDALSLMLAPEPGARSGEGWEEEDLRLRIVSVR